jgi:acetylglutamate kinase
MKKNIIVIKFGGSILDNIKNRKTFFKNIKECMKFNYYPVIIHGGGKEVSLLSTKLGLTPKFVNGIRFTDKETLEVVEMVLSGKINKQLTAEANNAGVKSIGLSGRDCDIIKGKKKKNFGFTGDVMKVNLDLLKILLDNKIVPIISSVASDGKSGALNINADEAAYSIAVSLKANRLIFMTDTKGVLRDIKNEKSVIGELNVSEAEYLIKKGIISGGMIPKIRSCIKGLERGIKEIDIVDGRVKNILTLTFRENTLSGTRITK